MAHAYESSSYCRSTERNEVFAYCGYSEEASGSGKHGLVGATDPRMDCEKCKVAHRKAEAEMMAETEAFYG